MSLGLLLSMLMAWTAPIARAQTPPTDDDDLRGYHTANGLLSRGLNDLAADEYRRFLDAHPTHEKAPPARYGLAVSLFRAQKYAPALEEIGRIDAAAAFPFAAESLAIAGQCHLALKQWEQAAKRFESLLRRFPEHDLADDATGLLAEALYRNEKLADAAARCADLTKRWPDSPLRERTDLLASLIDLAENDATAASDRLTRWLERYPNSADADRAALALAQAEQRLGRGESAADRLRQLLQRPDGPCAADARLTLASILRDGGRRDEAAKLLEPLLVGGAGTAPPAAQMQGARLAFDAGDFDAACAVFDELEKNEKLDDAVRVEAGYWGGKCRLRAGKAAEAARKLSDLLARRPECSLAAEISYDRAVALYRANQLDAAAEALASFREKFARHALRGDALHMLAAIAHQQREFDKSLEMCRVFFKEHPKHELSPKVVLLVGENEFYAGRFERAIDALQKFERGYPESEDRSRASLWIGLSLHRLGRENDAEKRLSPLADRAGKDEILRSALSALGDIQFSRGEWKAAEERFRAYLAGGSSPAAADDAWLKLGLACLRQEHAEDALKAFDALLESFPDSPHRLQARFERGQALAALKRTDDARAAFEQVLKEGKDSRFAPFANEHLAAIAAQNRDFGEAAKRYRLAMDAEPAGAASDVAIRRAEALAAGGEFAKAEEALNEFLRSNVRSERTPQALALLAIAQSRQDRFAEALKTVATAEARGLSRLDAAMQRNMRQEQAWCLRKLGKADEAAAIYRDLLRDATAPTDWHSLLALGELDADADRLDQAIEALARIRSAAKEDKAPPAEVLESARYRLGVCQFKANKFADAALTLEEFAVSHAESKLLPSALYFLGESHMRLSAFARAAESFGKVVESFSADAACGPSLLRLGEAHASLQDWAKSEKSFAGFLDRFAASESWYQARFGLGWARENQGRHDEAIAAYREVVERHKGPTAARAQFQIGECLFAKKQHAEAVRELLKVDILYAYPEWSAAALYEAGQCFEQLNQTGEARTQYNVVAEKHAGTRWAELAKQRLAALSAAAAAPPGGGAH